MSDPMVRLRAVRRAYGDVRAVQKVDWDVPRGTVCGLLGPNGSGKSTTIRMVVGLLAPDSGTIEVLGGAPGTHLRARLGYLPEQRALYPQMRVREVLVFVGRLRGLTAPDARARVDAWLERLDLADRADAVLADLSKGMQQKVAIASSLLHDPELAILDEPFSGLDVVHQERLATLVRELAASGTTVVLSTHLMGHAEALCDRVCMLASGRVVAEGAVDDLRRAGRDGWVRVVFDGPDGWLEGPEVVQVVRERGGARVRLVEGDVGSALLGRAAASGAVVHRYAWEEPSLSDLFLRRTGGTAEEAA